MTNALEAEKIAHAATQANLTKVKSSKAILAKFVSEQKYNKVGFGLTHEPMPESIANTLPESFNPLDHSPENEERFKDIHRNKSESGSSDGKDDEKIMSEIMKEESVSVGNDDQESEK
ncbi:hypothetical protein QVD17_08576 [Tagetes erecta]|uniref:Uncharacterized protein n=1 Tax=Tagetes erecta TaxID=13708 RepID=A0AAD8L4L8_TARER|nr:hypothetical protein QVD17_08576 [Tagetes erecta]